VWAATGVTVIGAAAAQEREPSQPFSVELAHWTRSLEDVELYLRSGDQTPEQTVAYADMVGTIRAEAERVRAEARAEIRTTEQLLAALGEQPGPDTTAAVPESGSVTERRQELQQRLSVLQSRAALADLTASRAEQLEQRLSALYRSELVSRLQTRLPMPLAPETIAVAVPEFLGHMRRLAALPVTWYESLTPEDRQFGVLVPPLVRVAVVVLLALLLRSFLLRRFGQGSQIPHPTYTRRLFAAVIETAARGIVPAAVFGMVAWRVSVGDTPLTGTIADVAESFAWVMFFYLLAVSAPRAILAPENPAYRLTALKPRNTRIISRRMIGLATVLAIDFFFQMLGNDEVQVSDELVSLYLFVVKGLQAAFVVMLGSPRIWQTETPPPEVTEGTSHMVGQSDRGGTFWRWVRILSRILAVVAIIALLLGFARMGEYLIRGLISTGLVLGGLLLIRGFFRETIGLILRTRFFTERLGLRHGTRSSVKFWLRAALDPLMVFAGISVILPIWGVPWPEIRRLTGEALEGFTIGEVTISPIDVLLAIAAFLVVLMVFRWLQRMMSERVLPELEIEPGLQNSLTTGLGYIGLILAVVLGISVMGIDLTTLAVILGALSVGIGFGLQNIVNNFVSGFVLLIERPVNVGDWVVIGPHEGFVKRINPRSTEIETWQKASVIVPNADFISQAVTNWTLTDKNGRVEVRVHVVRECNTARVRDILLQIANEHPKVLVDPEPFVLFQDFNPSSFEFELRCYTNDVIWMLTIASDIRYEIDRKFRAEGIEIPFPRQVVHMGRAEADDAMPDIILRGGPMERGTSAAGDGQ
jgi:small-conductance mechanosensitive channel